MTSTIMAISIGATISAALTHFIYRGAQGFRGTTDFSHVGHVMSSSMYTDEAKHDLITNLPGLSYDPGFKQFSGYLTVDKEHGRNIHYWYVESQGSPSEDPVVYWTNGGPGCSGLLGFGLEHGPFFFSESGELSPNEFSWNKVANMLYVEQPAGVGFSYSDTESDYPTNDQKTAADNYVLIREFLTRFPERQGNAFYATSESYGGHYMPQLTRKILNLNVDGFINFKGMLVGNPWVDPGSNMLTRFSALYSHGLVAKPVYDTFLKVCTGADAYDPSYECEQVMEMIYTTMSTGINPYALDYPMCTPGYLDDSELLRRVHSPSSQVWHMFKKSNSGPPFLPPQDDYKPCAENYFTAYMNRHDAQAALHVKSGVNWGPCTDDVKYSNDDYLSTVVNLYRDLIHDGVKGVHNLTMLIMSGDDDAVCALEGTQDWIYDLGVEAKIGGLWNPWYAASEVAGYVTKFDLGSRTKATFTLVTVHGSGHEVPAYRPMEGLELFKIFLGGEW